jgi:AcrR family transcriptional regulator
MAARARQTDTLAADGDALVLRAVPIRPALQLRSQAAFERVLRAGLDLLEERGYQGFTLLEVSRRAGVSVGSIYSRAASKDVLIGALHERAMERIAADTAQTLVPERFDGLEADQAIRALVEALARLMLRHARILSVFMHLSNTHEEIWRRGSHYSHGLARQFEALLALHRGGITHADPDLAIDICFRIVYGAAARRIAQGEAFESELPLDGDAFVDQLGEVAVSYLTRPRATAL